MLRGGQKGRRLRLAARILALVAVACLGWSVFIEPNRLVVRVVKIEAPLPHLRVAVLSDLHAGAPFITLDKVRTIVDRILEQHPDVILLLGDFVIGHGKRQGGVPGGHYISIGAIVRELARLKAPLGVFAVLGNHDEWADSGDGEIRAAFRSTSIPVLTNESTKVMVNGAPLWLVGVGDVETGKDDVAAALKNVPVGEQTLVFGHEPDMFPLVPKWVGLTIAGHTHGGQVSLPLVGALIVPSRYGQRYVRGLVEEDGHQLFVTSGVGTSILPVRFGVTPEIVILDL